MSSVETHDELQRGFVPTGNPDYYCSSIKDFKDNQETIRDSRLIEFESLTYNLLSDNGKFQLKDLTGELEVKLLADACKIGRFMNRMKSNF